MEAKGLPADADALDELFALSDARSGGGGGSGGGDREGEKKGDSSDKPLGSEQLNTIAPPFDLDRDFQAEISEDNLTGVLGVFLRGLASRADEEGGKLALFNQLRGKEGSWVILPFRFALDEVDFSGSFRIQLPHLRGGQGRFEADFSASRGLKSEDWSFFASFGGARPPSLRLVTPSSGKLLAKRAKAFAAELDLLRCGLQVSTRETEGGANRSALGSHGGFDLDA
jgi:hypothetical protein